MHISDITHLHADRTDTDVVLLCADLWQVGNSGKLSLASVQYGAVFSAVAQLNQ